MKKDDGIYLSHILESLDQVLEYTKGLSREEFYGNRVVQDAVIRQLEIVGEATKNISPDFRNKYTNIPWKKMAGMRDKLIHDYFGVDIDAVWDTAKRDVAELRRTLSEITPTK